MRTLPLTCALCFVALAVAGCSSSKDQAPTSAPTTTAVGGFSVQLTSSPARLQLAAPDGRLLLEGLAPGPIEPDSPPLVGFAVREVEEKYQMQFGAFRPTDQAKGPWSAAQQLVQIPDSAGLLVQLQDGQGRTLATLRFTSPESGHLRVEVAPGTGPERRFSWGFACSDSDHFMGFGAQSIDVDHRGQTVPTWVQEQGVGKDKDDTYSGLWMIKGRRHSSQLPIPQYLSRRGYVLTTETNLRSTFALCSERQDTARVEFEMPAVVHLFDGPEPAKAIERATATFGRPRMPPRFAFAPWNDAIFGSDNVRRVAQKLRQKGIPSGAMWTEDWAGGAFDGDAYKLAEEWAVDRTLYPDFEQLASDLHTQGFKFLLYFNTFVYEDSSVWQTLASQGLLVKKPDGSPYTFAGSKLTTAGLLDLSNPQGHDWILGQLKNAMTMGADGWMGDFAEWLPTDSVTQAGPGLEQHNVYPVLWQKVQREAIDSAKDGVDRLFFARSGWFGTPALADVVWAGDQRTDFEPDDGLPVVIPIGIGLGIVGISTYGHDIGGYQSTTNPPGSKELFYRWTELGAFSPVMRTHHGYQPRLNWNWESDEESTEHYARYAKQHMALVPLWEGLAKVASATGLPIWRGLALAYPEDESVWPILDEVMIGEGLLLAPVLTQGATSRRVYLPKGSWYRWEGSSLPLDGSQWIEESAPVEEIPVFAKAGSVIPMYPQGVMTLANGSQEVPGPESIGDDRVVRVFWGESGSFEEAGGLRYELQVQEASQGTGISYQWQGVKLAACATPLQAPCVKAMAPGLDRLHLIGPGSITVLAQDKSVGQITATGGDSLRKITWEVRHN